MHDEDTLQVKRLIVGSLQSNCYIISEKQSNESIIIDPGGDPEYIADYIAKNRYIPRCIIATHGHFDHILGAFSLQVIFSIPFYIHKDDEFLVENMASSATYWLGHKSFDPPPQITEFLSENVITFVQHRFNIIHCPGHTPGGVCIYNEKNKIMFVGDLLFKDGGVGRTDFSYSNTNYLQRSITKVLSYPKDVTVYSGHGEKTTILKELPHFHRSDHSESKGNSPQKTL